MTPGVPHSREGQWYRLALWLCPPVFRREHAEEMSCDFDEARGEAAARGTGALWMLRLLIAIDLARTVGGQWLRTGIPAIALGLVSLHLAVAEVLATITRLATIPMPDHMTHGDVMGVLLLAVTAVVVIGTTIVLNLWVTRLTRHRRESAHALRTRPDEAVRRPAGTRPRELRAAAR